MSRSLSELKAECAQRGLVVTPSGSRESKADYENALRNAIWEEQYPGQPLPPQYQPTLAFDYKNLVPGKMNANDPDPVEMMQDGSKWVAQEKMQGCRLLLHIGRSSAQHGTKNWVHSRRVSDQTFRMNDNSGSFRHITDVDFGPEWEGAVLDGEALSSRVDIDTGDTVTRDVEKATIALTNMDPDRAMEVQKAQGYLHIHLFDCLFGRGGRDMRQLPYDERLTETALFTQHCEELGVAEVEVLPIVKTDKEKFYNDIVERGGEGIMLKNSDAPYDHKRSRSVYKRKKFIEIDGWVSGFVPSDEAAGWSNLIGALEFSAYTETGAVHPFAVCANLTLEDRKAMTVQGPDGKPALNPDTLGMIAAIRGMEWSSRSYRLSNARIQRWREGEGPDSKRKEDCFLDLAAVKAEVEARGSGE